MERAYALPAQTPLGVLSKLRLAATFPDFSEDHDGNSRVDEMNLVASAMRDLEHMAGGAT